MLSNAVIDKTIVDKTMNGLTVTYLLQQNEFSF